MTAGIAPFTIDVNADFAQQLTWTDSSGNPIDLTGYSAKMEIANFAGPGNTVYYTLQSSGMSPGITFAVLLGIINLFIPGAATAAFNFSPAVYDLVLTAPGGQIIRLLQGPVTLNLGVTTV